MEPGSPIKGLERLSEELRLERQKSTYALQEKARVRVEIESQKQTIEEQRERIKELEEKCDQFVSRIHQLELDTKVLSEVTETQKSEHDQALEHLESLQSQLEESIEESQRYRELLSRKDNDVNELRVKLETWDRKGHTKDELIQSLKDELTNLRKSQSDFEQEKEDVYGRLRHQTALAQELTAQLEMTGTQESGYHDTLASNEELREALEKTLGLNQVLNEQVRDLQLQMHSQSHSLGETQGQFAHLIAQRDALKAQCEELGRIDEELRARVAAEVASREAAELKAQSAAEGRRFADAQAAQYQAAFEDALQQTTTLSRETQEQQEAMARLQEEVRGAADAALEIQRLQQELAAQQTLTLELEMLRGQLQHLRRKLVKKDLEDESLQQLAPKAIFEREQQARAVYEGIITELRREVDRLSTLQQTTLVECDAHKLQAARSSALEEELALYRETAQAAALESQAMALSTAEVAERAQRSEHERHRMQQLLQQRDVALQRTAQDLAAQQAEGAELRDKLKEAQRLKLAAEKRAVELQTQILRLETQLEESRRVQDQQVYEQHAAAQRQADLAQQLQVAAQRVESFAALQREHEELKERLRVVTGAAQSQEHALSRGLEALQTEKHIVQSELAQTQQQVQTERERFLRAQEEISALRRDRDSALRDKEAALQAHAAQAQELQHSAVRRVQSELQQTLSDWRSLEQESAAKEVLLTQLQRDATREKERAVLLQLQLTLAEERLQTVTQELAVYRGIDLYHAARQSALLDVNNSNNNNNNTSNDDPAAHASSAHEHHHHQSGDAHHSSGEGEDTPREDHVDDEEDDDDFGHRDAIRRRSSVNNNNNNNSSSFSSNNSNNNNSSRAQASSVYRASRLSLADIAPPSPAKETQKPRPAPPSSGYSASPRPDSGSSGSPSRPFSRSDFRNPYRHPDTQTQTPRLSASVGRLAQTSSRSGDLGGGWSPRRSQALPESVLEERALRRQQRETHLRHQILQRHQLAQTQPAHTQTQTQTQTQSASASGQRHLLGGGRLARSQLSASGASQYAMELDRARRLLTL